MDVSDVIARREFMPTYTWLDVAFLIGFAALLVWRRKYMTLLVGLVMGGVYFAVGDGAFNLLTHSRSISGGSTFWVLLWMSVSYGFTNFSWLWLRLSRDRHLAEWSMLILVWWFCCPLMSQTFTARFASGMQPIVIQRTTGAYHGWMAVILSRRRMVDHAVCRRSAWIPADQARGRRRYPKHLMYECTGISPTLLYSRTTIVRTACQRWFSNHPAQSTTASMLLPSGSSTNAE